MKSVAIKLVENAQLKLVVDDEDKKIFDDVLFWSNEKAIEIKKNTMLCRCGKSNNQPFCDGVHKKVGFKSSNILEKEIIQRYDGKQINIIFNRSICAGAGTCVRNYPNIYKNASENWIFPDEDSLEVAIKSVEQCPSGALSYEIKGQSVQEKYKGIKMSVVPRGPLNIKGKVSLDASKWSTNANKEKYSLCRCGASDNKPFCDYTHASLKDESYTF